MNLGDVGVNESLRITDPTLLIFIIQIGLIYVFFFNGYTILYGDIPTP